MPHDHHHKKHHHQDPHGKALGFDEVKILLETTPALEVHAGGHQGGQDVNGAHEKEKDIELLSLEVERGEGQVEVDHAKEKGHYQVDEDLLGLGLGLFHFLYFFFTQWERSFQIGTTGVGSLQRIIPTFCQKCNTAKKIKILRGKRVGNP